MEKKMVFYEILLLRILKKSKNQNSQRRTLLKFPSEIVFMQSSLLKNGQVSIFIIIAIIILASIAILFSVQKDILNKDDNRRVLPDSIFECMDFTTKSSLYLVTYQGGYNNEPEKYFSFSPVFFPYYYNEGEILIPSIDLIEKEMADYVDENLVSCFNQTKLSDFNLSYDEPSTKVEISRNKISYIVDMSVKLEKGEKTLLFELEENPVYYDSNFLNLYETAKFYVEDIKENQGYYCISCIGEMAVNKELYFYILPLFEDMNLIMVAEKGNEPLILNFITKSEVNNENEE